MSDTPNPTPTPQPTPALAAEPKAAPTSIDAMLGVDDAQFAKDFGLATESPPDPGAEPAKPDEKPTEPAATDQKVAADASKPDEPKEGTDVPKPGTEYWQDDKGKWHRPDNAFASADEIAAIQSELEPAAEGEPAEEEPPAKPAGIPLPPSVVATDAEGNPLEALPDVRVTYTANGKVRENVTLDKLVRQAQSATYNEELQNEALQLRQAKAEYEARVTAYETQLRELDAMYGKLLSDDDYYLQARETFSAQNSPEKRAERAEQRLRELENGESETRQMQEARSTIQAKLVPAVTSMLEQFNQVSFEEAMGRFTMLTAPLLVNGRIPPNRLSEVERIISNDLTHWVQSRHDERSERETKQETAAKKRLDAERVKAALAKRQLTRATGQKAGNVPALREAPKPKQYKSVDDVMDDMDNIVKEVIGATG